MTSPPATRTSASAPARSAAVQRAAAIGESRTRTAGLPAARTFVAVGSSVDPEVHVPRALERLADAVGLLGVSTFYRTPALERPSDPPFVNGVVEVRDALPPAELEALLGRIEEAEGRRRSADRFAPRPIDLDLLLHGDAVSSSPELPHPDVARRRFVALPLLELAPELVLPGSGARLADLARALPPYPMERIPGLARELERRFVDGRREG
jgi:2-amino-4-hydroxy-6-hydroxymethyldihydropteridine diphosphokinase